MSGGYPSSTRLVTDLKTPPAGPALGNRGTRWSVYMDRQTGHWWATEKAGPAVVQSVRFSDPAEARAYAFRRACRGMWQLTGTTVHHYNDEVSRSTWKYAVGILAGAILFVLVVAAVVWALVEFPAAPWEVWQ